MMVHLLVRKSAKNESIKGELEGYSILHLKTYLKWSKMYKNMKKKICFTLPLMVYSRAQSKVRQMVHFRVHLRMHFVIIP